MQAPHSVLLSFRNVWALALSVSLNLSAFAADTPQPFSGVNSRLAAISAGATHTCALTINGAVLCWGSNRRGQLGNGGNHNSNAPQPVTRLAVGVAAIAAGDSHSCALNTLGAVLCWGANQHGQLGNGTTVDSNTPQPVFGLATGVASISAGAFHTCAITLDGTAHCWGLNSVGQLGIGGRSNSQTPRPVAVTVARVRYASINAGTLETCAITMDGAAQCWGR